MRGARILDAGKIETRDYPDPTPQGEEVVVRLEAAAVCGSDLHGLYQTPGEKKWIPGHEGAGVVVAVDRPRVLKVGDRVATSAVFSCGVCDLCRAGYTIYCRQPRGTYGFGLDGVHAQYVRMSERSLLRMPDFMTFEQGCLVLDPVGTPYHMYKRTQTTSLHVVGVFGAGPMGLGTVCVGAFLGAKVVAVEPVAYRRELAKKLGAAEAIDPAAGDVVRQIRDLTKGYGLDRAVECSGEAEPLAWGLELVRHFGQVAIIGERQESRINPSNHFLRKEVTLSGSTCFPLQEFDELARMFERGLRAAEMITHRFTVDQAAEAYATFATKQTGKVIFVPKK